MENKDLLLKNYLSELQLGIQTVVYTKCPSTWRAYNYTPTFSSVGFICSGEGWISVDGRDLYPAEGQMYLLPAHTRQCFSTISQNTYQKFYCHFNIRSGDTSIFKVIRLPLCITVQDRQRVEGLYRQMMENHERTDITSILKARALLLELVAYYFEQVGLQNIGVPDKEQNQNLKKALAFIEENLQEELTTEKIAGVTGYHPCYFIKLFKDTFQMTPGRYITQRRLEKARSLLLSTELSIAAVAGEAGFNSQFYFSSLFKTTMGLTPTEYRNAFMHSPKE